MTRLRHPARNIVPLWLWPNLLGLDSPAVAIAWQWLFARVFHVDLPEISHLILGLSVWCVYLADRLYDAIRAKNISKGTHRLRFTKQHLAALAITAAAAGGTNLFLIIRHVPEDLVISGLGTAALLAIYYGFRMFGRGRISVIVPREVLCGMIFALGSVLAVDYHAGLPGPDPGFIIPVFFLGLLCAAACILISIWERDADLATSDTSFATRRTGVPAQLPAAVSLLAIVCSVMAFFGSWQIYLALAFSALALRLMLHSEKQLSVTTLRVLADGVLLSPLLVVWFT